MSNNNPIITIYHDCETDQYQVTDSSGEFDDFWTADRSEAESEAEGWADHLNGIIQRS